VKYTALIEGELVEIELTGKSSSIEATIGGSKYAIDVQTIEPGVYWFNWNNRSIEISVISNGSGYVVSLEGRRVPVEIVDARTAFRKATHRAQDGAVELRAPMPGKVVKLLVGEGVEVEAHQSILVMEAMKMQNEIKSPKKGIVKRLAVKESAAVNAHDLLAIVE
jgi:biotin carboxyl carrier protein